MNEKFYLLPAEKQQKIICAGFRVFSQNTYKKSPVQEIADCAGISKSLLFHYFQNKRELYFFLWDEAMEISIRYLSESGCYELSDLFEMMERGMRAKIKIMRDYPDMTAFVVKAFYEKDPEISMEIQKKYRQAFDIKGGRELARINPNDFIPGLDLKMMYREMYLAAEGYLWEISQRGDSFDAGMLEKDFKEMLDFWKSIYQRKE